MRASPFLTKDNTDYASDIDGEVPSNDSSRNYSTPTYNDAISRSLSGIRVCVQERIPEESPTKKTPSPKSNKLVPFFSPFSKPRLRESETVIGEDATNDQSSLVRRATLRRQHFRKFVVIEIFDGGHKLRHWQCAEAVREIHRRTGADDTSSGTLTYRDIRQVFNDSHQVPSIEVRRCCLVVCFPPVTAVLLVDRVFVLVIEDLRIDSLIRDLEHVSLLYSSPKRARISKKAFEIIALETLLSAAFEQLNQDIVQLESEFTRIRTKLQKRNPTSLDLENLHDIKAPIKVYADRVKAFDKAFDELTGSPISMARMELTKLSKNPDLYETAAPVSDPNSDLELLLEFFDQEIDLFTERVNKIQQSINDAERLISLRLSLMRNRLINLEMSATLISAGIALGTCLSGLFGMNLRSGFEQSYVMFIVISVIVAVVTAASGFLVIYVWNTIRT